MYFNKQLLSKFPMEWSVYMLITLDVLEGSLIPGARNRPRRSNNPFDIQHKIHGIMRN